MSKVLGFLGSNFGLYAVIALVLAFAGALTVQTLRLSASEVELAEQKVITAGVRTAIAEERGRNATLTKEVSEANRAVEEVKKQGAKDVANAVLAENRRTRASMEADLAAARDRESALGLQRQLADFTAGFGGASGTAAAAGAGLSAQERATALGVVLGTCAETSIRDAGELEEQATQIRGLQAYDAVVNGIWDGGQHR